MWKRIFAASLLGCSLSPLSAEQASIPEPQYSQQFNALKDGQLVVLERQTAVPDTQSRRFFVITPSTRVFESISNPASPVRVGPETHFIIRMSTGDRDPQTLIHLQKLTQGKKDREVPIVTYKVSLIPGGGVNHKRAPDEPIPIAIKQYGKGSLEIVPQQPLEPGEYAFMSGHAAQCFGVDAGLSSGSSLSVATRPAPPSPPKLWRIEKLPEISDDGRDVTQTSAILEGQSTVGAVTGGAYLVMHCGFPTTTYPNLLPLEAILVGTDEMFSAPGAPGMFVDITDFALSQLGTAGSINVNATAQNRSNGARVRFFYDAPDMEEIVNAAGQTLRLSVNSGSTPAKGSRAVFALPSDNTPLKEMMSACLQKSAVDDAALQARTVASCPVPKDGTLLDSVALIYVASGKDVHGDIEGEDSGGLWKLPAPAKGRPVRKVQMSCVYRSEGTSEGAPATDRITVPVPETARSCNFAVHKNARRSRAVCLAAPSR